MHSEIPNEHILELSILLVPVVNTDLTRMEIELKTGQQVTVECMSVMPEDHFTTNTHTFCLYR